MKRLVLAIFGVVLFLVPSNFIFAQHSRQGNYQGNGDGVPTGTVKGVIINSTTSEPLGYAYVVLFKAMDSSMVSGGITDTTGTYRLEKIPFGKYYLAINLIGHKPLKISNIIINPKNLLKVLDTTRLDPTSATLTTVEIKGNKDVVQYTLDKKVINVEKSLVTAGGSAVDVMQNIPSVTVDIDGNISMRGSGNITVLVDGKPSGLTGMSRSAILEQIPASAIESIEIITNPSAKYDPDGMSGIINIVLKKKKEKGYHGVITLNAGTGDKYNGSLSFNYSKNKLNIFSSFDARQNNSTGSSDFYRELNFNDTLSYVNQLSKSMRKGFSYNVKFGFDYSINDKNSLTVSALYGKSSRDRDNTETSLATDYLHNFSNYYETVNNEAEDGTSIDYMFNYKKTFAKKGRSITVDAVYSTGNDREDNLQKLQYYNQDLSPANATPDLTRIANDDKDNNFNIQMDYSNAISKTSKYEIGAKSSIKKIDNDYKYNQFSYTITDWNLNTDISNRFLYDENINAMYGTYSNTINLFEFQAGLRFEKAFTEATQKTTDTSFTKNYFSIFPTMHLNYKLKNDNSLQLSYSRRVNRPSYQMLNPFVDISDPLMRHYGNPDLDPEYIDSYELGHLKYWDKFSVNSSVFYRQINNIIQRYATIDSLGIQNVTSMNLSKGLSYGFEFVVQSDITKWWKLNVSYSYFKTEVQGSPDGTELTNSNYSWTAKLNSNMTVMKNLDIQITGNYRAPMVQLQGTMQAMYSADIAMKKDILKNKASISFRLSDIFNTQQFNMHRTGTNFIIDMKRKRESRVAYIGFTYKINGGQKGKDKKKVIDTNNTIDVNDF